MAKTFQRTPCSTTHVQKAIERQRLDKCRHIRERDVVFKFTVVDGTPEGPRNDPPQNLSNVLHRALAWINFTEQLDATCTWPAFQRTFDMNGSNGQPGATVIGTNFPPRVSSYQCER